MTSNIKKHHAKKDKIKIKKYYKVIKDINN
jgi:hypothetical protein